MTIRSRWRRGVAVAMALAAMAGGAALHAAPAGAASGDPIEITAIGNVGTMSCPSVPVSQMPDASDVSYCHDWFNSKKPGESRIWYYWEAEHRHSGGNDGFWYVHSTKYDWDGATLTNLGAWTYSYTRDCVMPWFHWGNYYLTVLWEPYNEEPRHGDHVQYNNCDVTSPTFTRDVYTYNAYTNTYDPPVNWGTPGPYQSGGGFIFHYVNERDNAQTDHWDPYGIWTGAGSYIAQEFTTSTLTGLSYYQTWMLY